MTHIIGLTGSIGMGKTTTADMFKDRGIPVWDADSAVHNLYKKNGAAVAEMAQAFPNAIQDNAVSRDALRAMITKDPSVLKKIEAIVHPLVKQSRSDFIENSTAPIVVLDIPLLFETSGDRLVDTVICVSVSPEIQKKRVMDRGTMTPEMFDKILQKQMPDAQKRAKSDYVIITDTLEGAASSVDTILAEISKDLSHA